MNQQERRKSDFYKGNPRLRRSNVRIEYTPEQLYELAKCRHDPVYFIRKYIKIVHVDMGLVPFKLWDFQERLIDTVHENRFVIGVCPRQVGKTTTISSYILHQIIFNNQYGAAILANKGQTASEIMDRIRKSFEYLPFWMQQGVVEWNKRSIVLENGSRVFAGTTSSSGIRGMSFNFILLDEFAHIHNNMAEEFFESTYPVIASGKTTKVVIISTPKGLNYFYNMWVRAEDGTSNYVPFRAYWNEVPGRDEAWKAETIANTSEQQFAQEMECVGRNTPVTIRNTATGKIETIPIEILYERLNS